MITQQLRRRTQHARTVLRKTGPRLGRPAAVPATVTAALLPLASAAFASTPIPVPGPGGQYVPVPAGPATITRVITTGGMPGWQIALIALGAALVAATAAVILDRTLARRRPVSATTA
jgi:hypothetical protein